MSGVTVATTIMSISSGLNALRRQQFFRGLRSQMRRRDARIRIVPLANARARANPVVRRIHHLFDVRVGDHARRQVPGHSRNFRGNSMAHQFSVSRANRPRLYAIPRCGDKQNTHLTRRLSAPRQTFSPAHSS